MGILTIKFSTGQKLSEPVEIDDGIKGRSRTATLPTNRVNRPSLSRPRTVRDIVNVGSVQPSSRPAPIPQNNSGITVSQAPVTSYLIQYRMANSGEEFISHPTLVTKGPVIISNLPEGVYEVTVSSVCNGMITGTAREISQTAPDYYIQ